MIFHTLKNIIVFQHKVVLNLISQLNRSQKHTYQQYVFMY